MLTKEQMDALPKLVEMFNHGDITEMMDAEDAIDDISADLATTVIEQQAEIERLRGALAGVMDYAEEGALTIDAQPALDAAYVALGATQ